MCANVLLVDLEGHFLLGLRQFLMSYCVILLESYVYYVADFVLL